MTDTPPATRLPEALLKEIQGNVYPGFKKPHQAFLFVRFPEDDPGPIRAWLRKLAPEIASASQILPVNARFKELRSAGREHEITPTHWVNVAFSYQGFERMKARAHEEFPEDFKQTPQQRARAVSDPVGEMLTWNLGGSSGTEADAVVILGADTSADLEESLRKQRELLDRYGPYWSLLLRGEARGGGKEHFGFKDNISQPIPVEAHEPTDTEAQVLAGEFILSLERYPRYDSAFLDGRESWTSRPELRFPDWAERGSYLVFRQIQQQVDAFRKAARKAAAALHEKGVPDFECPAKTAALFEAKCIGRWPDGTPLNDRPSLSTTSRVAGEPRTPTADDYREDKFGLKTPLFAHIRKVHPRDFVETVPASLTHPEKTIDRARNHQLIRRGITYVSEPPATGERGILFVAYQASIREQFEFILQRWATDPLFGTLDLDETVDNRGPGIDPISVRGARRGQRIIAYPNGFANPPTVADRGPLKEARTPVDPFVVMRGGGYFFSPSITRLHELAAEPSASTDVHEEP